MCVHSKNGKDSVLPNLEFHKWTAALGRIISHRLEHMIPQNEKVLLEHLIPLSM